MAKILIVDDEELAREMVRLRRGIAAFEKPGAGNQEADDALRLVLDSMSDMIRVTDLKGNMLYASPSHYRILGYSKEERVGKTGYDLIHPDDLEATIKAFTKAIADKTLATVEFRVRHADGHYLWLEAIGNFIRSQAGDPLGVLLCSRDITERKKLETVAQESEQRMKMALEGTNQCLWEWDAVNNRLSFDDSWQKIMGFTPGEREFDTAWWLANMHPESVPVFEKIMSRYLEGREKYYELKYRIKDKAGLWHWIWTRGIAVERDPAGIPLRMIGIHQDITAYKSMEAQTRQAKKMEAIGTLAGGIAHNFNNLLMGIQGYASLMMMDLSPSHPHHERLDIIQELVQNGAELTQQLLGYAQEGIHKIQPLDLNDFIGKTVSIFSRTRREITFGKNFQKDLWSIEADHAQVEQVLLSLLLNASQAMPDGGDLDLETQNVVLDRTGLLPEDYPLGKYVRISIKDTGTGMDDATRERIFDPFYTTQKMGRGTGLGLAESYGIIKSHKGMIHVESGQDRGTTFLIYLPAAEKKAPKPQRASPSLLRGHESLLLVDDEKFILMAGKEALEYLGYRVHAVGSGQEALL